MYIYMYVCMYFFISVKCVHEAEYMYIHVKVITVDSVAFNQCCF